MELTGPTAPPPICNAPAASPGLYLSRPRCTALGLYYVCPPAVSRLLVYISPYVVVALVCYSEHRYCVLANLIIRA